MNAFKTPAMGRAGAAFILKLALLVVLSSQTSPSFAEELRGKVIGAEKAVKRFVSVSIFGTVNRRTETNSEGMFLVDLPQGTYRIRISQNQQRKEFDHEVADSDPSVMTERTFEVDW